jgi:hypothetical protein
MASAEIQPNRELWSDAELSEAVNVYLLLLRLQLSELEFGGEEFAHSLLATVLVRRNNAAIRYRMRNISHVAVGMGIPTLSAFSPAPKLGRGVKARIEGLIKSNALAEGLLRMGRLSQKSPQPSANSALQDLENAILEIEDCFGGIGHNGPPDSIDPELPNNVFDEAKQDVVALKNELESDTPNRKEVSQRSQRLVSFAERLAIWSAERLTRFADASLKVAAPLIVAKIFGLMPVLVSALEAVSKVVSG